jgi:hypothetical protein
MRWICAQQLDSVGASRWRAAPRHCGTSPPWHTNYEPKHCCTSQQWHTKPVAFAVYLSLLTATVLFAGGCKALEPSNHRDWAPDQALLPQATIDGDRVHIQNVRNCRYLSEDDFVVDYYDKTVRLSDLRTVDFVMVPFAEIPSLAHTMLSFGFADDYHLAVSVEIRRERDESFAIWKGLARQYELMYVVGDERDLIKLRTHHRLDDVYVYRAKATPEQARALLVDVLGRANKLAAEPEFYHGMWNNCTTNIASHVNRISPNRVPYGLQVLLPGYSDRLAYDLGLLATSAPFPYARQQARVNELAYRAGADENFSTAIRR